MDEKKSKKPVIGAVVLIAIVLLIPVLFASEPYRLSIMIFILINVVFAVSMRLIMTTEQIIQP